MSTVIIQVRRKITSTRLSWPTGSVVTHRLFPSPRPSVLYQEEREVQTGGMSLPGSPSPSPSTLGQREVEGSSVGSRTRDP